MTPIDDPLVQRAILQHQLGQGQAALDTVRQLQNVHPNHADLWHLEGRFLDEQGRPEAAVLAFAKAIDLDPNHRLAWDNLAWLEGRQDPQQGITRYKQLLQRFGDHPTPWHNLACLLRDQGHLELALHGFTRALALDGSRAPMWFNLGKLHLLLGSPHEARAAFEQALVCDADFDVASEAIEALDA
jgi:Flp pilus assembly protein TadD